jgi:hypothetical protein
MGYAMVAMDFVSFKHRLGANSSSHSEQMGSHVGIRWLQPRSAGLLRDLFCVLSRDDDEA